MQAADTEVLNQIASWLAAGRRCWLATVVETWGSSPRPVGSLLTCDADGHLVGSLSGGCVEDDLLEKLQTGSLGAQRAEYFSYGITVEETERLGLPCGGHLNIVVEPLQPDADTLAHFSHLQSKLQVRERVQRVVNLNTGKAELLDVDAPAELAWDSASQILTQTFGPRYQLFIIGAGMVSAYLAQLALMLDYQVTVCDPRQALLDDFAVSAVTKICDMPDDAVRAHAQDPESAIVALTHDPRIDDMGLMEALQTQAFYIGAMGSTRTSANRRERLLALDVTPAQIDELHAPIGLSIGSKTPPEIAIAIIAEITAVRKQQVAKAQTQLNAIAG